MEASPDSRKYKNYAFISYSRKDEREASWLHKALEWFRIPTELPPLPDGAKVPKYVRPVFRDKKDLEVRPESFVEQIKRELAASRFLIVVCSPNAARSRPNGQHYVDWEIRQFIEAHGADYAQTHILPVILEGDPGCGDPERECLPPALLELGPAFQEHNFPLLKDLPADRRGQKAAREDCVIGCVAFLLGVARTTIYDRHLRAQRERMRNYLALAAGVALALAGLTGWAVVERSRAETERGHAESAKNDAIVARDLAKAKQAEAETEKKRADEQAQLATQQRDLAEKQKSLSDGTLRFLTGLFYSIDPEVAKTRDVTVREVLENVDAELARDAKRSPLSEEAIRTVIAQTYDKLGLYAKALEQGKAALRLAETNPDLRESQELPRLYNNVGFWMDNLGDSGGAVEMYGKALELYQARSDTDPMDMAQLFDNLGNCALRIGSFAEAEGMLVKSLEWRRSEHAGDHLTVFQSLSNLGNFEMTMGRYAKAQELFGEAAEMAMRLNGGSRESVSVARIEGNIALCQLQQKRFAEALGNAERSVETRRRLLKTETKELAVAINNQGLCLAGLSRLDEALGRYDEALAMMGRVAPGDLAETASILDNQGASLCVLQRYPEALAKQTEALAMRQRIHGEDADHVDLARNLNNVASTYAWLGEHRKAEETMQQALAMYDRVFEGDHPDKVQCLENLANCHEQLGKRDDAARCRERAAAMREHLSKPAEPATGDAASTTRSQ